MYIYIQIHWWCIRCPAPKIQVAVDVARCLCNLVQAGNSACYHREIWAFSQLSVVVDADFARFLEKILFFTGPSMRVTGSGGVAFLLRWFDWKLGEGEVLPWRIKLWNFLYLSHLQNFSRNHHWSPMLRDTLQETNTNSSEGSWVVGKMSFPTSIGRICRQFTGGYGISDHPRVGLPI